MIALLTAVLVAVPAARAQQPQEEPPARTEPSLPERVIDGIRGIFRSIFGSGDAETPPQSPQPPQESPAQSQQQEPKPREQANPAAKSEPPVAATPSAQALPQSLHSAIAKGDYSNALKMIEQGADIEAKDPGAGASALHYAVMKGEMPMVGLLVQRGADVNSRTKTGTTPLHTAVLYGRYEAVEYLMDKGADINARSASGATPLSLADAANLKSIGRLLRGRGAK